MKVMLLGATGLTGGKVLEGLLAKDEVSQVVAPVRHKLPTLHKKLRQHEIDFDQMADHANLFNVDSIVCCLGTTIKKAGSQQQFRTVDFGYPLKAAELGKGKMLRLGRDTEKVMRAATYLHGTVTGTKITQGMKAAELGQGRAHPDM